MSRRGSVITLTTDFGNADPWVGIMKGVIAGINPDAAVIDLSHGISPQNIREAAFVLFVGTPFFPKGTVHVAVVDPGVGGARRALAVKTAERLLVGPDNGVLSWALGDVTQAVFREIREADYIREPVSSTFHGRDVFAPAAAHLSRGVKIEALGPPAADPVVLEFPRASRDGRTISGEVLYVDRFGNLITNIRPDDRRSVREVAIGDTTICGLSAHYGQGGDGRPIALVGSTDFLEIAVNRGNAAERLGACVGDKVKVSL
jgi:S-adenosylmethionine hydrolase